MAPLRWETRRVCRGQSGQPMGEKTGGQKQRGELRQTTGRRLPPVRNRASQGGGESDPGTDAASVTSEKGQPALEGREGPLPDGFPLPAPSGGLPNQQPLQDEWGMGHACAVSPGDGSPPPRRPEVPGGWNQAGRSGGNSPRQFYTFLFPLRHVHPAWLGRPCSRPADFSHQTL